MSTGISTDVSTGVPTRGNPGGSGLVSAAKNVGVDSDLWPWRLRRAKTASWCQQLLVRAGLGGPNCEVCTVSAGVLLLCKKALGID